MRVLNFDKVVYDGYATLDLFIYIIKSKPTKIFKLLKLIPRLFLFLIKRIDDRKLVEDFYILLLQNITISELEVYKINNISKLDLVGFGIDQNDVIVTGEPAFLIDLFIDRTQYKVICTEYDLHNSLISEDICIGENKAKSLIANGIEQITQLFVANLKEKEIMQMADDIFIYRDHEVFDIDTYKPRLKDRIFYNISNTNTIIFVILSLFTMFLALLIQMVTSYFFEGVLSYLLGYIFWLVSLYPLFVTLVHKQLFSLDYLGNFILGFLHNFLLQFILIVIFNKILGWNASVVFLLSNLISYPL
ncbi:MAG: hypothetical protein ACRCTA_07770, partial [Bacilli bacterium]